MRTSSRRDDLTKPTRIVDDLDALVEILPARVQQSLSEQGSLSDLLEVVLDLGRPPEARFPSGQVLLDSREVSEHEIQWVIERVSNFGDDNRAGIERTLHRISVIRNRVGKPVGLTCRVGRAVFGTIRVVEDLVFSGDSLLLMGRPGVGKTTMLREVARVLADDADKRVVVVDTSNEIAGDGDVPHPGIGRARRMQVARTNLQHQVMIEAVENHMPEVIIVDEMSTDLEAMAARTIAERGVQLVATAHGNSLQNLLSNPALSDLVGGTQAVTLGDVEARRRRTQKTVLERKQRPTFNTLIEIHNWNHVGVHHNVARVVDNMLRGFPAEPEMRWLDENGDVRRSHQGRREPERPPAGVDANGSGQKDTRGLVREDRAPVLDRPRTDSEEEEPLEVTKIVAFGIPRPMLQAEVERMGAAVEVVKDLANAEVLVTTKSHYRRRPTAVRSAEQSGMPVYVLRKGSTEQIRRYLRRFARRAGEGEPTLSPSRRGGNGVGRRNGVGTAVEEAEAGVERILQGETRVELTPQAAFVRRLQHGIASRADVGSASVGTEPYRRVVLRRRQN